MDYCAICGCDISELGSNRCLGFACEKRLCFKCFSDTGGYCPTCKIYWELDGIRGNVGKYDTSDELYDQLAGMPEREAQLDEEVRKRREREEEERVEDEEERQKKKQEKFEKDRSTEGYILRKIRDLNREMEKELREEEEEDEEDEE
jgi:hypothetical protein